MLSGAGDELQGIKRGIMEMADVIAITKADGDNVRNSEKACNEYRNALHLFPAAESGWSPRVMTISARLNSGLSELWSLIEAYLDQVKANGYFEKNRRGQSRQWMYESIQEQLLNHFFKNPKMSHPIKEIENLVLQGKISSFQAAGRLLNLYFGKLDAGIEPREKVHRDSIQPF